MPREHCGTETEASFFENRRQSSALCRGVSGNDMSKYRIRAWLDDGLFVVLIMAAAAASAALEAGALFGGASSHAQAMARAGPPAAAKQAAAAASAASAASLAQRAGVVSVLARASR